MTNTSRTYQLLAWLVIISLLIVAAPTPAEAGSNGQQIVIWNLCFKDGFLSHNRDFTVTITGRNQNNQMTVWVHNTNGCTTETWGYFWKGQVQIQVRYLDFDGQYRMLSRWKFIPVVYPKSTYDVYL